MATKPVFPALASYPRPTLSGVFSRYFALTKPEVNFLIAVTAAVAFRVGSSAPLRNFPWMLFVNTVLGTLLVASGAGALNQWIERRFDAKMRRTARRPIAAGGIEPSHALVFGTILSIAGVVYLDVTVLPTAGLLALLTLVSYLFVYTPLGPPPAALHASWSIPGSHAGLDRLYRGNRETRRPGVAALCDRLPLAVSALHGDRLDVSRRLRPRGISSASA